MTSDDVIRNVMDEWNAAADEFNKWDTLGCDEKLELVVQFMMKGNSDDNNGV